MAIIYKTVRPSAAELKNMRDLAALVGGEVTEVEHDSPSGNVLWSVVATSGGDKCKVPGCRETPWFWLRMPGPEAYFPAQHVIVHWDGALYVPITFVYTAPYKGLCDGHVYTAQPIHAVPPVQADGTWDPKAQNWISGEWRWGGYRDDTGCAFYGYAPTSYIGRRTSRVGRYGINHPTWNLLKAVPA